MEEPSGKSALSTYQRNRVLIFKEKDRQKVQRTDVNTTSFVKADGQRAEVLKV